METRKSWKELQKTGKEREELYRKVGVEGAVNVVDRRKGIDREGGQGRVGLSVYSICPDK